MYNQLFLSSIKDKNMNKTFRIEIIEILQRVVEIEAKSIEIAIETITQQYKSEEIILDYSDFLEYTIS